MDRPIASVTPRRLPRSTSEEQGEKRVMAAAGKVEVDGDGAREERRE